MAFTACGPPETDPGALRGDDGSALYGDGTWAAAFSHTNSYGWRPFAVIRVRAGLIDQVRLDAVDAAGNRLRDVESYIEQYRLVSGAQLIDALAGFEQSVLTRQRAGMIVPSGTIDWAVQYDLLLRAAIGLAVTAGSGEGIQSVATVATAGPYLAYDDPDRLGWRAELTVVYDAGAVAAVSFIETREQLDGTRIVKRDTQAYQTRFGAFSGTDSATVSAALADRVVGLDLADRVEVDVQSGATLSSNRFGVLIERVRALRIDASLPRRWNRF
ncbi:MAG: hypothetical protein EA382_12855 [Spirochaetaceae bacterium]|nr:MAG: hypothetical protein EA382_12855 [Spirochaetaceae bacterium]